MKKEPEYNLEGVVERSYIYKEDGFIVNAFAVNKELGKVAVLRRHDKKNATETKGLCKIEFYSTFDMPRMFFEKSVIIQDTLVEGISWIGSTFLACVCLDGSVITISPFSTTKKRHQISSTPFWCVASFSTDQIVAGTDSGNVYLLKYTEKQGNEMGEITVVKQFSVGSDQRSLSIAASNKLGLIAVGCLDKVFVINRSDGKSITIQMQREHRRATIAWSLLFFGANLIIGDSRGNISIYNSANGALLKNILAHQAAVLALASDGDSVYSSGVDYRIQQIRPIQDKNDWTTVGQRIVHENDVRAMEFVDKWLLSGGAEHDILISLNTATVYHPIKSAEWGVSEGLKYQLIPSLFALTLVERRRNSFDQVIPAKTVGVSSKTYVFEKSGITPDGLHVVASTCKALKIYALKMQPGNPPRIGKIAQINSPGVVTAMALTNQAVFYTVDNFELRKVDFNTKNETVLYHCRKSSSIRKLLLSSDGKMLAALSFRNDVYFMDISANKISEESKSFHHFTVREPIIDFCWNDKRGIVVLSSTRNPFKLIFLNGKMQQFPAFEIFDTSVNVKNVKEYPVAMSSIVEKRLIIVSNLRRYTVLEFDAELKALVKYECGPAENVVAAAAAASATTTDAKTGGNEVVNSKSSRLNRFVGNNSRLVPEWAKAVKNEEEKVGGAAAAANSSTIRTRAQERRLVNGQVPTSSPSSSSASAAAVAVSAAAAATKDALEETSLFGKQRIFLCGIESESPPSQVPFVIKRFDRN